MVSTKVSINKLKQNEYDVYILLLILIRHFWGSKTFEKITRKAIEEDLDKNGLTINISGAPFEMKSLSYVLFFQRIRPKLPISLTLKGDFFGGPGGHQSKINKGFQPILQTNMPIKTIDGKSLGTQKINLTNVAVAGEINGIDWSFAGFSSTWESKLVEKNSPEYRLGEKLNSIMLDIFKIKQK